MPCEEEGAGRQEGRKRRIFCQPLFSRLLHGDLRHQSLNGLRRFVYRGIGARLRSSPQHLAALHGKWPLRVGRLVGRVVKIRVRACCAFVEMSRAER